MLKQSLPPGWKDLENQKLRTVFQSLTPFRIDEKETHDAKVDTLMLAAVLYAAQASTRIDSRSSLLGHIVLERESRDARG